MQKRQRWLVLSDWTVVVDVAGDLAEVGTAQIVTAVTAAVVLVVIVAGVGDNAAVVKGVGLVVVVAEV